MSSATTLPTHLQPTHIHTVIATDTHVAAQRLVTQPKQYNLRTIGVIALLLLLLFATPVLIILGALSFTLNIFSGDPLVIGITLVSLGVLLFFVLCLLTVRLCTLLNPSKAYKYRAGGGAHSSSRHSKRSRSPRRKVVTPWTAEKALSQSGAGGGNGVSAPPVSGSHAVVTGKIRHPKVQSSVHSSHPVEFSYSSSSSIHTIAERSESDEDIHLSIMIASNDGYPSYPAVADTDLIQAVRPSRQTSDPTELASPIGLRCSTPLEKV